MNTVRHYVNLVITNVVQLATGPVQKNVTVVDMLGTEISAQTLARLLNIRTTENADLAMRIV